MRVFGIDPGSERTGYGCVDTDGRVTRLVFPKPGWALLILLINDAGTKNGEL